MRWFIRRLTVVIAVAFVALAVAVIATPGTSSADCDHNMSWNPATLECKPPPPPPPPWYTPPPPYAPSFAGQDEPFVDGESGERRHAGDLAHPDIE
ncbi:hypothetical protein [Mycobacterium sp. E3247]|uniref:hypothetical protein n=1 Tax=Mycobacterium sp. E3247 TaxID=1856864 RepID=UPI001E2B2566|nr:hypothetical protein [Mycobacterium sp. E3247]